MPSLSSSLAASPSQFAATRWSIVLAAVNWRNSPVSSAAMSELTELYWFPLYAFLRRQGHSPHCSEDLVQAFLVHLLENGTLNSVDRSKGRFRSFLLASLKNFVCNEWDKSIAQKRGGGAKRISLELKNAETRYEIEPADLLTPERVFERQWAIELLDHVLMRLRNQYAANRQLELFEALKGTLVELEPMRYAQIGLQLGMTEGAVKVAAHRLRRNYRSVLRDEISQTVSAPELVNEEIQQLLKSL